MRITTIPFRLEVANGSSKSQTSELLSVPFTVLEILLIFPNNTNNKLIYRFILSATREIPSTGLPGGTDLFFGIVEKGEFIGENITYTVPVQKQVKDLSMFLKFYAQNDASGTLIASACVIVALPD